MNRRNVVITEQELEQIRFVIKDWLFVDTHEQRANQELRDEVIQLLNSLPICDKDIDWSESNTN